MGAARPTSSRPTRSPPPPGAGKTTLVARYLDARGLAAAWYRVDEGDRDIASFFHYLTLAVRQAAPRGKALPVFSPEYGAAAGAFARLFFREAWEQLGDRILVLDDYQDARSPSPLDEVLRVALSELPERSGVLVTSRGPPPPALVRLLANGDMAYLAPAELKLTVTEWTSTRCTSSCAGPRRSPRDQEPRRTRCLRS